MKDVETIGFWEPGGSRRKPDWTPGLEVWGAGGPVCTGRGERCPSQA